MALTRRAFVGAATLGLAGGPAGCLLERDMFLPYRGFDPRPIDDGWVIATPEASGIDAAELESIYRELHAGALWQARSLLVFRHGRLVAESYLKDDGDRTTPRAIWSCTKQFVGVLTGIALDRGIVGSVADPLAAYLTEIEQDFPDKAAVTLENVLEMRSGIGFSNDGTDGHTSQLLRQIPADSARFILRLPLSNEPGTVWQYHDGNPHLLSLSIQRQVGRPLDAWADEVLFQPTGLTNYRWRRYRDGSTLGGFGMLTTPRELAKLGQLVLDDGQWQGQPVVSSTWLAAMTAPRVDTKRDAYGFGYQWWFHRPLALAVMAGHGGQYVFVDRATRTLMVMTAEPNTQGDHEVDLDEAADWAERVLQTVVA